MSNVKGEFKFVLGIDFETTGLKFDSMDSSEGHQILSCGIIVADAKTFKPIEELYLEIKWNDEMKAKRLVDSSFGKYAEKIHGLTMEYLEENGVEEQQAVQYIGTLILKYFGPTSSVRCLGHNVHLFDYRFLISLFKKYDIDLPMANRHIDTSTIGNVLLGAYTSDQLFETLGFEQRDKHDALDDVKMSLKACEIISKLWKEKVGLVLE